MAAKPGPKKGSAPSRVRGEALPKLPGYTKLPGKSERYRANNGETISKRQYLALQRKRVVGESVSLERFAKINRVINKQVAASTLDAPIEEKRRLAFKALRAGKNRGLRPMFKILRQELQYDLGRDDNGDSLMEFWWDEHES